MADGVLLFEELSVHTLVQGIVRLYHSLYYCKFNYQVPLLTSETVEGPTDVFQREIYTVVTCLFLENHRETILRYRSTSLSACLLRWCPPNTR
jgi:hypothetical protein